MFYFTNAGLGRIAIMVERREIESTLKALQNKYGTPSSSSSVEQWGNVDDYPDRCAEAGFDADTVLLRVCSDDKMKQSVLVIYTSSEFAQQYQNEGSNKLKDDL